MKRVKSSFGSKVKPRCEMRYFDDLMNPVTRDMATIAVFLEFDEEGNVTFEAQGFID